MRCIRKPTCTASGISMRRKEKLVVVFIGTAFFMLCMGGILYLPQSEEGLISRAYVKFVGPQNQASKSERLDSLQPNLPQEKQVINIVDVPVKVVQQQILTTQGKALYFNFFLNEKKSICP